MDAILGNGPFRTRLTLILLVLAGGTPALAVAADLGTLRGADPVVVRLPEAPRDAGHRHTADEIRDLAIKARGYRESTPEGVAPHVLFEHPMRKGITNPRPGFYAISNYVDQDEAAPDMLLDYECGDRTYDLDDGFNHNGIDYFNFPFSWLGMEQDASIVVAAADGVIIDKQDGEPDRNCSFNDDAESNYVILEHDDGSASVYLHFKQGSTTARAIGDMVEKGDYLGVVGSSGFSNGPHLHFGVYDSGGGLIEPHAGACNSLNSDSWWESQENYFVPSLSFVATHSAVPDFPPCPGVEQPNFKDNFGPGETAFFSAFFRDLLSEVTVNLSLHDSSGVQLLQWTYDYEDSEHASAVMVVWGVDLASGAASGDYTFRVSYAGETREHTFYINSGPNPPPVATAANNAQNGLFFDPGLDGEGYNFVTAGAGTIVYFYGSDQNGNRLWLISDLIRGDFGPGSAIEVTMFESTGGTFGSPVPSARGLSVWGTLSIVFSDCNNAVATLSGVDGVKVSQLVKLAGVAGTACTAGGATADSSWSGLWYDLGDEGEGYNLVVAPNGAILYFYGFKTAGGRLWLISDLIQSELQVNQGVQIAMFEAVQGTFDNPAPSSQLAQWGTATITLVDCNRITIGLVGNDGSKASSTVRLAGVIGLDCGS